MAESKPTHRWRFTPEQNEQIRREYEAGASAPQLAAKWGTGSKGIFRAVERAGGKTRSISESKRNRPNELIRRFTSGEDRLILADREAGMRMAQMVEKWGASREAVRNAIRRAGGRQPGRSEGQRGKKCPRPRVCTLNEAAFDGAENDPVASYFVGLLMADGCVCRDQYSATIYLGLQADDADTVLGFRRFVGSSHKVVYSDTPTGRKAILSFRSNRMAATLESYGVVPRKSLTATVPDCLVNSRDFWRGMIDGDGCVAVMGRGRRATLGLCGSRDCCDAFLAYLRNVTPTRATVRPNGAIWSVTVGHQHAVRAARHFYDPCVIAMPRKLQAALSLQAPGRPKGEKHNKAKLTDDVVRAIRERYLLRGRGDVGRMADEFGVDRTTIHAVATRRLWRHID